MSLLTLVPWYYRAIGIACLIAACVGFGYVKGLHHEEVKFGVFKAEVEAQGVLAQAEATRKNKLQQTNLEEVSNAWKTQLPLARDNAVAAYVAHHPVGVPRLDPSSGGVRGPAESVKGDDGAGQEQVATGHACRLDDKFIQDAAEDALTLGEWQQLAVKNGWTVE